MNVKHLRATWLVPATPIETHVHVSPKLHRVVEHHLIAVVANGLQWQYLISVVLN